jgi:hypothetical protein
MEHIIREVTDLAPHQQHKQGLSFLSKQVMEASHTNPERMKEGPFLQGKVIYSS